MKIIVGKGVKELNCSWEYLKEHYANIKKCDKLFAKKQAKRDKKVDDSVDKFKKIQEVKTPQGWNSFRFLKENLLL